MGVEAEEADLDTVGVAEEAGLVAVVGLVRVADSGALRQEEAAGRMVLLRGAAKAEVMVDVWAVSRVADPVAGQVAVAGWDLCMVAVEGVKREQFEEVLKVEVMEAAPDSHLAEEKEAGAVVEVAMD